MRTFFGMILGAVLTIAGAYSYDAATGKAMTAMESNPVVAPEDAPLVNWDVVGRKWHNIEADLRGVAARVHEQWVRRSG